MDTCSLPLKIHFWIVSPELMSLKHPMSHENRIPGWKAVCGKVVGRCTAALALLPCSCAAEEKSQQVKALHGWQGELEATAGAHSGRTKADRGSSRYSKYFGVLFFLLGEKCGSELPPWRHHKEWLCPFDTFLSFGGSLGPTLHSEDSLLGLRVSALTRQQH